MLINIRNNNKRKLSIWQQRMASHRSGMPASVSTMACKKPRVNGVINIAMAKCRIAQAYRAIMLAI